jgi:pyruvate formate lyase activating enzyme
MQAEFLEAALEWCKALRIHTVVDTCGFAERRAVVAASQHTDLFLFDLKVVDDARHRLVTGVSNDVILGNLRELARRGAQVRIRIPLVPGVNDDPENVDAIGRLLREIGLRCVDLLPYHRAGLAKYARLDLESRLPDLQPPSDAVVAVVAGRLAEYGLAVHVGG